MNNKRLIIQNKKKYAQVRDKELFFYWKREKIEQNNSNEWEGRENIKMRILEQKKEKKEYEK